MKKNLTQEAGRGKLVFINDDNRVVATSLKVAGTFGKRHDHILRDIENLISKDVPNFGEISVPDGYGRPRKAFEMDRDGYTLLAMGFTGDNALQFKMKYIEAFNAMEAELMNQNKSMSQLEVLAGVATGLVEQEKQLKRIEATTEETKADVEKIKHKIDTNGCEPGFIPQRDAYSLYGQTFSYQMFKSILRKYRQPFSRYSYKTPEGEQGFGTSVKVAGLSDMLLGFAEQCKKVSACFFIHPDFGDKKFKVFNGI